MAGLPRCVCDLLHRAPCLTSVSAPPGPTPCAIARQLWPALIRCFLGRRWLSFLLGTAAKFSPPPLVAFINCNRMDHYCLESGEKITSACRQRFPSFLVLIVFKVSRGSRGSRGDKLEEQSSTFCPPHCTRARLQHACLPQQNEKSIRVSHLPHLCRTIDPDTMISQCE